MEKSSPSHRDCSLPRSSQRRNQVPSAARYPKPDLRKKKKTEKKKKVKKILTLVVLCVRTRKLQWQKIENICASHTTHVGRMASRGTQQVQSWFLVLKD